MSADRPEPELVVSFTSPAGEEVRVEWDGEALGRLGRDRRAERGLWRLAGELDWDEVEALRVLSGRADDGRVLAIAALRPRGAAGHGEDAVGGTIVADGGAEELAEVLLSTEYVGEAEVHRVGLELYRTEDGMPLRAAADATGTESEVVGGVRRDRIALDLRLAGSPGAGLLEVLRRA
jgi:YD repeat-containing protein